MASMDTVTAMQQAIRIQATDLREELDDLARWEDEASTIVPIAEEVAPIRGTGPTPPKPTSSKSQSQIVDEARTAGNACFHKKDFAGAVSEYSRGIKGNERFSGTHALFGNRAMCFLKLEKWAEAETDATKSIELQRNYAKGYYRRAQARRGLGRLAEARSDLEAVLALSPNDGEALAELASITAQMRQSTAASAPKRRALVIEEVDDEDESATSIGPQSDPPVTSHSPASNTQGPPQVTHATQAPTPQSSGKAQAPTPQSSGKAQAPTPQSSGKAQGEVHGTSRPPGTRRPVSFVEVLSDDDDATTPAPRKRSSDERLGSPPQRRSTWSKDALRAPKSFVEFERMFLDVAHIPSAMDYLLSLIQPGDLPRLCGSSLTPTMFMGLVEATERMDSDRAAAFLEGLGRVQRIDEILMFCDGAEKQQLSQALQHALQGNPASASFLRRTYS